MRSLTRALAATALAFPLALAGAGAAFADDMDGGMDTTYFHQAQAYHQQGSADQGSADEAYLPYGQHKKHHKHKSSHVNQNFGNQACGTGLGGLAGIGKCDDFN